MPKSIIGLFLFYLVSFTHAAPLQVALPEITPHSFTTPDGKKHGLYVDLLTAIGKEAGVQFQFQIMPLARTVNMINKGESDLAVLNVSAVQAGTVRNLGQIYAINLVLWPSPKNQFDSAAQLKNKTVGRLRGGCQRVLDQAPPSFYEINNFEQGVRMLSAERLDGLCGSHDAILFAIRRNALPALEVGQPLLLERAPIFLLARKNLPNDVAQRLEQASQKVMQSGLLPQLLNQYGLK